MFFQIGGLVTDPTKIFSWQYIESFFLLFGFELFKYHVKYKVYCQAPSNPTINWIVRIVTRIVWIVESVDYVEEDTASLAINAI